MIKQKNKKYSAWIVTQPCAKCGHYRENHINPAHQRILGGGGMSLKPHDKDLLPLCSIPDFFCHDSEHKGAVTFWGQGTKAKTKIFVQDLCDKHIERYKEYKNNARK